MVARAPLKNENGKIATKMARFLDIVVLSEGRKMRVGGWVMAGFVSGSAEEGFC